MPDFPGKLSTPTGILSTADSEHCGFAGGSMTAGGAWPAANRAIYVPVLVEQPVLVTQMAVWVTAQAGNLDVGIYSEKLGRLVSAGSTPVGTAGALQAVNITDTTLDPGLFFLALCCDTISASFLRANVGGADFYRLCGIQQQAVGAVTLPDPAVFANPSSAYCPVIQAIVMSSTI